MIRKLNRCVSRRQATRPRLEALEAREVLSQVVPTLPTARPYPMQVMLGPATAMGAPQDGVTDCSQVVILGRTLPRMIVGMDMNEDGRLDRNDRFTRANRDGWFRFRADLNADLSQMEFGLVIRRPMAMVPLNIVSMPPNSVHRPFNGSPTPGDRPFDRLVPNSVAYGENVTPRPDARDLSEALEEDAANPTFSPTIPLGLVFFGQFVDHDVTLMNVVAQGPTPDPAVPRNIRTPALDLDPIYGRGPIDQPEFYNEDGLFLRVGAEGQDLHRTDHGVAIIGDERNDENGQIARIHLAFQRFHNAVMAEKLGDIDPATLTPMQKSMLFSMTRSHVVGYYQGLVANQLAPALAGRALPDDMPPRAQMPVEFTAAVFRVGHTLIPNEVIVDAQGTRKSPVDASLRGPGAGIPFTLLFGPDAQPAAHLDDKIAPVMRKLLIPLSPAGPQHGDLVGGGAPNIGQGQIIDGVLHLDLMETNLLRGREQHLPSGEEYLHRVLLNQPYDPNTDGNTDLFVYMLRETVAAGGTLGPVGRDIFERTLGGILAADPYRYTNPAIYTAEEIKTFRNATFEDLLRRIGEPGF